jgi:hypothetical protein
LKRASLTRPKSRDGLRLSRARGGACKFDCLPDHRRQQVAAHEPIAGSVKRAI